MTTALAEKLYEDQHLREHENLGFAVWNPNNKPIGELPFIYGFNNGGSPQFLHAQLVSEDGMGLGSHMCSSEAYMPADLDCLEGTRSDRHETFAKYYPDGYRMEFVGKAQIETHEGLQAALAAAKARSYQGAEVNT